MEEEELVDNELFQDEKKEEMTPEGNGPESDYVLTNIDEEIEVSFEIEEEVIEEPIDVSNSNLTSSNGEEKLLSSNSEVKGNNLEEGELEDGELNLSNKEEGNKSPTQEEEKLDPSDTKAAFNLVKKKANTESRRKFKFKAVKN